MIRTSAASRRAAMRARRVHYWNVVIWVAEEDREVWHVTGEPSEEALARAAAAVVDELADRARAYVAGLEEDAAH
jgi:hypothetical protein